MTGLFACPACACHVKPGETECPHCGERIRRPDGSLPRTAAAILLGLTAAAMPVTLGVGGCSSDTEDDGQTSADADQSGAAAPAYGVPETSSGTGGNGGNGGNGGDGGDGTGGLGGSGDGGAGGAGGKGTGGQGGGAAPAYGVPETTSGGS